jgi:hypothetical protein
MKTKCILVGYMNEVVLHPGKTTLLNQGYLITSARRLMKKWILKTDFTLLVCLHFKFI